MSSFIATIGARARMYIARSYIKLRISALSDDLDTSMAESAQNLAIVEELEEILHILGGKK
jgi:hypothetical protein